MMLVLNGEWAVVSTLSGAGLGFADMAGTNAGFRHPTGVAIDASGNVFVGDTYNQRIRKVTAGGGTRQSLLHACNADIDVVAPM